jgi:hypothetical protein
MTKAAVLDFDSLDTAQACEKPYEFELVHPQSKAPLGVFVSVVGPESSAFKNKIRAQINSDRRKEFEAQRNPRKAAGPATIEQDEAQSVDLIADLVKGWRTVLDGKSEPVIYWKGESLPFNADNAKRWLTHFPWVRDQVNEAAGDLGNFLGN